ncbi:hypothetical protein VPH35_036773 [Triticum aestivum]
MTPSYSSPPPLCASTTGEASPLPQLHSSMRLVLRGQGMSSTLTPWSSLTTSPDVHFDFVVSCSCLCSSKHVSCDVGCAVVCNCDSGKNAAHSPGGDSLQVRTTLEKHVVRFAGEKSSLAIPEKIERIKGRAVHLISRRAHFF